MKPCFQLIVTEENLFLTKPVCGKNSFNYGSNQTVTSVPRGLVEAHRKISGQLVMAGFDWRRNPAHLLA